MGSPLNGWMAVIIIAVGAIWGINHYGLSWWWLTALPFVAIVGAFMAMAAGAFNPWNDGEFAEAFQGVEPDTNGGNGDS